MGLQRVGHYWATLTFFLFPPRETSAVTTWSFVPKRKSCLQRCPHSPDSLRVSSSTAASLCSPSALSVARKATKCACAVQAPHLRPAPLPRHPPEPQSSLDGTVVEASLYAAAALCPGVRTSHAQGTLSTACSASLLSVSGHLWLTSFVDRPTRIQDFSSPTRGGNGAPCIGELGVLTTEPPGKSETLTHFKLLFTSSAFTNNSKGELFGCGKTSGNRRFGLFGELWSVFGKNEVWDMKYRKWNGRGKEAWE